MKPTKGLWRWLTTGGELLSTSEQIQRGQAAKL
jgi:hypothetical protein